MDVDSRNKKNQLITGWNTQDFEASRGLDFNANMPVMVQLTHLDHNPFHYNIKVRWEGGRKGKDVVRIYEEDKRLKAEKKF